VPYIASQFRSTNEIENIQARRARIEKKHIHPQLGGACDCPARTTRTAIGAAATQMAGDVD
jgi:hypothetical protein